MKKNNIILLAVLGIAILIVGFLIFSKKGADNNGDISNILFYGDGCSHCANVEKYITDNNIEGKVEFVRKEVFNNQDNAKILVEKAKFCNIPTDNGVGVPFFWIVESKTCLVGETDIIDFLAKATTNE